MPANGLSEPLIFHGFMPIPVWNVVRLAGEHTLYGAISFGYSVPRYSSVCVLLPTPKSQEPSGVLVQPHYDT
jgi:hypothetical protein